MSAPAGPCEWCGGPQQWTIIRELMYVRCIRGCLPLDLEGLVPPSPLAREDYMLDEFWAKEPYGGEGVVPCEGGEAKMSEKERSDHQAELGDLPW